LDGFNVSLHNVQQAREELEKGNEERAWVCAGYAQVEAARLPFHLRRKVIETIYDLPWPNGSRAGGGSDA